MYTGFLHLHNFLRWLILLTGFLSIFMAWRGWLGKKNWTNFDNIFGITFTSLIDVQLLIGLALYFFLSPLTRVAFNDFGGAMKNPELRFYAVEHILAMIFAVVIIHIGRIRSKNASTPERQHRVAAILYTIGLILILSVIPWGRDLL